MTAPKSSVADVRTYRNTRLYRPLARTLRVYTAFIVARLHEQGFEDFSPAFPAILSNLDTQGTRIGVLATRAGVTRQAAGQLVREIERCGYASSSAAGDDARARVVRFTARGRKLLATIFALVDEFEAGLADVIGEREFKQARLGLLAIADHLDPGGAFGIGDEPSRSEGSE